jgi:hypothetical protein
MPAPGEHCPFLNRSDDRCSDYFNVSRLGYAFGHCFGAYNTCPVYLELLVERRLRRLTGSLHRLSDDDAAMSSPDAPRPLVQVTISHRHAKPAA